MQRCLPSWYNDCWIYLIFSYLSRVLFTSLGQKMSRYSWSWQGARMPVEGLTWKTSSVAKWNWICVASGLSPGSRGCKLGFMICQWKGSSKWLYSKMKKGERNRQKMCYLLISERNVAVAKNNNTESETEFISIFIISLLQLVRVLEPYLMLPCGQKFEKEEICLENTWDVRLLHIVSDDKLLLLHRVRVAWAETDKVLCSKVTHLSNHRRLLPPRHRHQLQCDQLALTWEANAHYTQCIIYCGA